MDPDPDSTPSDARVAAAIAARAPAALAHVNADHAEAVRDICVVLGGVAEATAARVFSVDALGCDLEAETPAGQVAVRVPFPSALRGPDDLRGAMVELTRRARLGG